MISTNPKSRNIVSRLSNVLILLLIIFNSGGVDIASNYYITIGILALIAAKIVVGGMFSMAAFLLSFSVFLCLLSFNFFVANVGSGSKEYLVYISYALTASCAVSIKRSSGDDFENDLYLALKIILFQSILSFAFQFIGRDFLYPMSERQFTFYYLFFYIPEGGMQGLMRNQGIFWEPGVCQMYLNLLFYIALFLRRNFKVAILSAAAVGTTFSTTGYIILFILVSFSFLQHARSSKLSMIGAIFLIPLISTPVMYNVIEKFTGEFANSSSVRIFDLMVGWGLLWDHPLTGVGLDSSLYKDLIYQYGLLLGNPESFGITPEILADKGITNSLLFLATSFGIPIAIFMLILLYNQTLIRGNKFLPFIIFIFTGLSEPIFNTVFFTLLFVSGLPYLLRTRIWRGS